MGASVFDVLTDTVVTRLNGCIFAITSASGPSSGSLLSTQTISLFCHIQNKHDLPSFSELGGLVNVSQSQGSADQWSDQTLAMMYCLMYCPRQYTTSRSWAETHREHHLGPLTRTCALPNAHTNFVIVIPINHTLFLIFRWFVPYMKPRPAVDYKMRRTTSNHQYDGGRQ